MALSAGDPSCSQVKQPGLVKEAVGPSLVIESFGLAPSFGSFSQDASQPASDPAVHTLKRVEFAMPEVVVPPPQDRINFPNDAFQALAVGSASSLAQLFAYFNFAFLTWPFLTPFEVITQELEASPLGCIYDLGFLWMQSELSFLHPFGDQF